MSASVFELDFVGVGHCSVGCDRADSLSVDYILQDIGRQSTTIFNYLHFYFEGELSGLPPSARDTCQAATVVDGSRP